MRKHILYVAGTMISFSCFIFNACTPTLNNMTLQFTKFPTSSSSKVVALRIHPKSKNYTAWNSFLNSKTFYKAVSRTLAQSGLFKAVRLEIDEGNSIGQSPDYVLTVRIIEAEAGGLPASSECIVGYTLMDQFESQIYKKTITAYGRSSSLIGGIRMKNAYEQATRNNLKVLLHDLYNILGNLESAPTNQPNTQTQTKDFALLFDSPVRNLTIDGKKYKKDPIYLKAGNYDVMFEKYGMPDKLIAHLLASGFTRIDRYTFVANLEQYGMPDKLIARLLASGFTRIDRYTFANLELSKDTVVWGIKKLTWEEYHVNFSGSAGKMYLISELSQKELTAK